MIVDRAFRRAAGVGGLIAAVTGGTVIAVHPAASAALAALQSAVTCATSTACVEGDNTGSGPGVTGTSAKGTAIIATGVSGLTANATSGNGVTVTTSTGYGVNALSKSGIGIKGTSYAQVAIEGVGNSSFGVEGQTSAGQAAVYGKSSTSGGYGVWGQMSGTTSGTAVYGSATYGTGVEGVVANGGFGLYGTSTSGYGDGVVGYVSGSGNGVAGTTSTGAGVEGTADSGAALYGLSGSGDGLYAYSTSGYGIDTQSYGAYTLHVTNPASGGDGSDISGSYLGIVGRAPAGTGSYPLVLTDSSANNLFYVDGNGNVSYKGGLYNFARVANGLTVKSYSPRSSAPTVEDTGTAQLTAGYAAVRLDPTFAASIDASAGYRVFVTPNGDTRGLFVPVKTANGFVVRETQGGHGTLSFDYRIVATALGQSGERMAVAAAAMSPHAPILSVGRPRIQQPKPLSVNR
jgi:hypothetical protein